MEESTQLAMVASNDQQGAMEVRSQVNQIQYLMQSVLKEGEHYGVVPGTGKNAKPSLFQSGAEKIAYMFHLVPRYECSRTDFDGGHREWEVTCSLTSRDTGEVVGYGMGSCSTLESKYRYRWVGKYPDRHREENPDIADQWNTVLKMAKKRAFVDAVKSTTAASDIFTQDVEDMPQFQGHQPQTQPAQEVAPPAQGDPDMVWIGGQVSALVGLGYDAVEVSKYLVSQWMAGGQSAAEAAVAQMRATAQPAQEVEAVVEEAI
jgi:hypothetical protein